MKEFKKSPRQQLERFSTIFMQLGLVLVLFVVFISLEYETEQEAVLIEKPVEELAHVYSFDTPIVYVKEVVKMPEPIKVVPKTVVVYKPEVVVNSTPDDIVLKTIIEPIIAEKGSIIVKEVVEEDIIDEKDEPKGIAFVSKIPVFKGCENLSKVEGKKCFDKKINKLVKRYFNAGLANDLGLTKGKKRIFTQFVIDKNGEVVDVKINAPHKALQKEVSRLIKKIPVFTPGENNGKPAKVRYTLPISFQVN